MFSHYCTHTHTHSLSHTHTHSLTHSFSLYLSLTLQVQYAFIHYAILEAITYGDTSFSLAEFPHSYQHLQQKNKETGQTLLEEEYSRLGSVKTMSKTSTFIQRVKQKGPTNRSIHYPGHGELHECVLLQVVIVVY